MVDILIVCYVLSTEYFPIDRRKADVIIAPKQAKNSSLPRTHRPINLLSNVSKIDGDSMTSFRICISSLRNNSAFDLSVVGDGFSNKEPTGAPVCTIHWVQLVVECLQDSGACHSIETP